MEENRRREELCLKIKKLALAFQTGWEYRPESGEAGSALMDAVCDMLLQNNRRFDRMWEKHTAEFLSVMPEESAEEPARILEIGVCANGENDGATLAQGTEVFLHPDQGEPLQFVTVESLRLTAAELLYVLYQDGLHLLQIYEKGQREQVKREIAEPVFCWQYENLCNGREEIRCVVDMPVNMGEWRISDGENSYLLRAESTDAGLLLAGETPVFWENRSPCVYELQLRFFYGEAPSEALFCQLCRSLSLKEERQSGRMQLCLTEDGAVDGERVLPFGRALEPSACCYFACDKILAVKGREITLEFTESFLSEQNLPQAVSEAYQKLYKKYPWLKEQNIVREWKAEETVWEYFDGSLWMALPGSREWKTGCVKQDTDLSAEGRRRSYQWMPPRTMNPCVVEGQEHYYIRLRLEKTVNEYAQYYRKRIPVLENVCVSAAQGEIRPVRCSFPEASEIGKKKLYFGFDREITEANRWRTAAGGLFFRREEIAGWGDRYGREAFWVEKNIAEADKAERNGANKDGIKADILDMAKLPDTAAMIPNYVQVVQVTGEDDAEGTPLKAQAGQLLSVETESAGVLDARLLSDVSFADTRTVSASALSRSEGGGRSSPPSALESGQDSYPAAFGRLVVPRDIAGWIRRRYPDLCMVSCTLQREEGTLLVVLRRQKNTADEETRKVLSELEQRLELALTTGSPLWLAGCNVSCVLERRGEGRQKA